MPPYYEIVEGLRLPARLAGHPALDFCNTWAGWDGDESSEYLETYRHLVTFTTFSGLLPADRAFQLTGEADSRRRAAASILERAREFRAGLYRSVLSRGADSPSGPVLDELRAAAGRMVLRPGAGRYEWELCERAGIAAPLLAVAWSAAGLLTSTDLSTVRTCPGAGCGWVFLDPRGRRRWCSMAACGNRAKARRFAASHKPEGSGDPSRGSTSE